MKTKQTAPLQPPHPLIASLRAQQQRALDEQARLAAKVMCDPRNPYNVRDYHTALGVVRGIRQAMALVESEALNF